MIIESSGDLLAADVDAQVNPVNTYGTMGKGLAAQFRDAYPPNFRAYRDACQRGELRPGQVMVFERALRHRPHLIINFPTKRHWRDASRLGDIVAGLDHLRQVVIDYNVWSIAVPALGCGLGGLDWARVYPAIATHLGSLPGVRVLVYPPQVPEIPVKVPQAREASPG